MTARSFSIAVTVPLTTLPSKPSSSPPRDSFKRAAKSSRVGFAEVAIKKSVLLVLLPASGCLRRSFDPTAAAAPCRRGCPGGRRWKTNKQKGASKAGHAAPYALSCPGFHERTARWTGRAIGEGGVRPQVVLAAGGEDRAAKWALMADSTRSASSRYHGKAAVRFADRKSTRMNSSH